MCKIISVDERALYELCTPECTVADDGMLNTARGIKVTHPTAEGDFEKVCSSNFSSVGAFK